MADIAFKDASQVVSIVGANSSGVETTSVGSSPKGELLSSDGISEGGVYGELTLTTGGTAYEAKVGVSALANRKSLVITALDDMYWGYNNSVTTANGIPLYRNQTVVFNINPNSTMTVFLVASANTKKARIAESV